MKPAFTVRTEDVEDELLQLTVRQEAQCVCSVTSNTSVNRSDILPLSLRRTNLQSGHMLREQQRQTAKIRVSAL